MQSSDALRAVRSSRRDMRSEISFALCLASNVRSSVAASTPTRQSRMPIIPIGIGFAAKKPALCQRKQPRASCAATGGDAYMPDIRLKLLGARAAPSAGDPVAGVIWITISMACSRGSRCSRARRWTRACTPSSWCSCATCSPACCWCRCWSTAGDPCRAPNGPASTACALPCRCCRCRPGSMPFP